MRFTDKVRKRIRHTLLLVTVAVLVSASWAERERNTDEEYAVYSAYLSEALLNDAHGYRISGNGQLSHYV